MHVAFEPQLAGVSAPAGSGGPSLDQPWLAVVNPVAGGARRQRAWRRIERALRAAGVRLETVTTSRPREGREVAAAAVRAGRRRLLVAGGDGSVHDVVNGLCAAAGPAPSSCPVTLGVLPLGTGNDWARSLRMPADHVELAAVVSRGRVAALDLGRIDFLERGDAAGTATCWFVNVAGAGFDAYVIERLPAPLPSGVAYLAGALARLARYRSPAFRIHIESAAADASRLDGRFLLAFVANGRYCGRRMKVAPAAMLDDGLLDVVTIDEVGLPGALARLAKLYRGTLLADPLVRHRLGSRVRIDAEPAAVVEADGQIVGRTPAIFSVLPRALHVLVP